MKSVIPAAIAIGVGIVTLLGFFFTSGQIVALRLIFTDWAVIVGALAVLLGLGNLMTVHARRIDQQAPGWVYSLLTALAAIGTLAIGLFESLRSGGPVLAQQDTVTHLLFQGVVVASQAALASLAMFFLVAAAVRMLKTKPSGWSVFFLIVVVISLIAWIPFPGLGLANQFRDWLISVPAAAGARGILLGVALGTIAIGLRVLTGMERPYKD
jgi:hypothetical protein